MTLRITLIAAALAFAAHAVAAPVVGKAAPDFSVTDANGKTQSLSAYKGKTVVLEWNNPECPFVGKHYGAKNMQEQQAAAASQGVVWLTVNSAATGKQGHLDGAGANAYLAKVGGKEAAYLLDGDGKVGHAYDAKTTPHMYVIDPKGTVIYAGGIDDKPSTDQADIAGATNYVSAALDDTLAGKAVRTSTSKPYGCSVKYSAAE